MSKFANLTLNIVSDDGGSNRVTIPADPYQIRGGTGTGGATSVPCRAALLTCPNGSSTVRVTIGTDCTATTGIKLPEQGGSTENAMYTPWIPIDDLNNLYFFGAAGEICDILYRK